MEPIASLPDYARDVQMDQAKIAAARQQAVMKRQQMMLQKVKDVSKLGENEPELATQIWNRDPDLRGLVPGEVTFKGKRGDLQIFDMKLGDRVKLMGIDKKTGQVKELAEEKVGAKPQAAGGGKPPKPLEQVQRKIINGQPLNPGEQVVADRWLKGTGGAKNDGPKKGDIEGQIMATIAEKGEAGLSPGQRTLWQRMQKADPAESAAIRGVTSGVAFAMATDEERDSLVQKALGSVRKAKAAAQPASAAPVEEDDDPPPTEEEIGALIQKPAGAPAASSSRDLGELSPEDVEAVKAEHGVTEDELVEMGYRLPGRR